MRTLVRFVLVFSLLISVAAAQLPSNDAVALGAVVNNLAKIYAANLRYQELYKKKACHLSQLGAPEGKAAASAEHAGLLEAALVSGKVGDYKYSMSCDGADSADGGLSLLATPLVEERPIFCTTENGSVARYSATVDVAGCRAGSTLDIYQVALVKEYCLLASNGLIETAKCVANGALPVFNKSRIAAYETSAIASLRNINTAEVSFATSYPDQGYATDLAALGKAGLIDNVLACAQSPCEKAGYRFKVTTEGNAPYASYWVTATPLEAGSTGQRSFCTDESGVIRDDASGKLIESRDACGKRPPLR